MMSRRSLIPKNLLMHFGPSKKRGNDKETLRRLYLAFHHRNPSTRDPSTISYSILLTEKNPSPDDNTCCRYRVNMEASLTDDVGLLEWAFSVESNQSTRAARPLSLLLLGKVSPEVTAREIELVLRSVPVNQAELVWSSSPWMLGALRVSSKAPLSFFTLRHIAASVSHREFDISDKFIYTHACIHVSLTGAPRVGYHPFRRRTFRASCQWYSVCARIRL